MRLRFLRRFLHHQDTLVPRKDGFGARRQRERRKLLVERLDVFLGQKVLQNEAHLGNRTPPQSAEGSFVFKPPAGDPTVLLSGQDLADPGGAETPAHLPDAGEDLLGVLGHVDLAEPRQAVRAVAAVFGRPFAEIAQDIVPEAAGHFRVDRHLFQAVVGAFFDELLLLRGQVGVGFRMVDQEAESPHVLRFVKQHAVGGRAVATRAPGLLIVFLDVLRHIVMDHERDVRLVDPHAEGVGRDHHRNAVENEILLIFPSDFGVEPGVVFRRRDPRFEEFFLDLLDGFARRAVDDAVFTLFSADDREQFLKTVFRSVNLEAQVRTIKSRRDPQRRTQTERILNIVLDLGGGGRGERRDHGAIAERVDEFGDFQVTRAKILPPLGDAMRLVDGEQIHLDRPTGVEKCGGNQPLRRDVDDLIQPPFEVLDRLVVLRRRQRTVQIRRADAVLRQGVDLILHQGDQGRHDQSDPSEQERRHLIAKRFPRPGRHHAEDVPPRQNGVDRLLLPAAEGRVAEILFQNGQFVGHRGPPFPVMPDFSTVYHFFPLFASVSYPARVLHKLFRLLFGRRV